MDTTSGLGLEVLPLHMVGPDNAHHGVIATCILEHNGVESDSFLGKLQALGHAVVLKGGHGPPGPPECRLGHR